MDNNIYLKNWNLENDGRVKLTYRDGAVLYVKKTDFDRAFGPIVSATKDVVAREFAI